MGKLHYVCKYTPVELLTSLGAACVCLNEEPEGFAHAEEIVSQNICGFGKAVVEAVLTNQVKELVLVNCCDTIRSVYDVLEITGDLDFLFLLDLPRDHSTCSVETLAAEIRRLADAYTDYSGTAFDIGRFLSCFTESGVPAEDYIGVLGARMGAQLAALAASSVPLPLKNFTCVNHRLVTLQTLTEADRASEDTLFAWYARVLLAQIPCMRMSDRTGRRQMTEDPHLKGIIYHTVKFCDFYGFEYAHLKEETTLPLLKIESDYTTQSAGQLKTRLEAFAETLPAVRTKLKGGTSVTTGKQSGGYFCGIDSGSTSTDVVILDDKLQIADSIILPTGAGAAKSADKALAQILEHAGLTLSDIRALVTTGYGRDAVGSGDKSVTEITCHARGAHHMHPEVRTVIDIGGQDSKVILLDEEGNVLNFVMNDKCAAGTGRFLEMMAKTMETTLDEFSSHGLSYKEDITISSMCTVFAESEVVSLVAENKDTDDIVHGLNKAVAVKTLGLVKRAGGVPAFMMTGGVARNKGLVQTLEKTLGHPLIVDDNAQLAGAIGAALFAHDL